MLTYHFSYEILSIFLIVIIFMVHVFFWFPISLISLALSFSITPLFQHFDVEYPIFKKLHFFIGFSFPLYLLTHFSWSLYNILKLAQLFFFVIFFLNVNALYKVTISYFNINSYDKGSPWSSLNFYLVKFFVCSNIVIDYQKLWRSSLNTL